MADKETKPAPKKQDEPTLEDRVTALEQAIGLSTAEEVVQAAPEGPPHPHELYVPGEEE